ncbi:MAG: thioredoxin [Flavobacteriaceae bacterium TMED120]|nr:MAG: thioredoxin [Flavobacteriaceae bacterium TMED120]
MKKIVFLIFLFLTACGPTIEPPKPLPVTEQTTFEEGTPYIIGAINRANLLTYAHSQWFQKEYDFFKLNTDWVEEMKPYAQGLQYKLFLGTWCEDSQREVPAMFKILDALGMQDQDILIYSMDEDKVTPQQYEKGLNIINIPTLIFYKDGQEMNRIVEFPVESLYKDMAKILKSEPYQDAYYDLVHP